MVLPPGAFLTLGLLLGIAEWMSGRRGKMRERRG